MTDDEEIALAKRLPKGSRKCLMVLTRTPTFPGLKTFNANAAHNLRWQVRHYGGLADYRVIDGRAAYSITPLGERIRDRLRARSTQEGDKLEERVRELESALKKAECAHNWQWIRTSVDLSNDSSVTERCSKCMMERTTQHMGGVGSGGGTALNRSTDRG